MYPRRLEYHTCPFNVRPNKITEIEERSVNVRFCRKMHNQREGVFAEQAVNEYRIAYIPFYMDVAALHIVFTRLTSLNIG
jgi:hypothetical protein